MARHGISNGSIRLQYNLVSVLAYQMLFLLVNHQRQSTEGKNLSLSYTNIHSESKCQ